ncbi:serine hydrolase domain-containing protein [Corynebacterium freiburgense]|uniref:serine hydrolase domain-containing protein n=1 Tax=Corynebacterium freiburgense TaxID=556548 RepID=UPI000428EFFB|nr:serine hydrolase domain-containing protein [Corynebacterium freiburgense]WJZ01812.1 Penicillin-binding protein 4* [Corynebacterium freiburgense]
MDSSALQTVLDQRLRGVIRTNGSNGPGAVALVVGPEGILAQASLGDLGLDSPVGLGSLSKSFTSRVLLSLVDRGLVKIDDEVARYIPNARVLPGTTLQNLAQHISGIRADGSLAADRKFRYSNVNYYLLGQVIEQVTKQPFRSVVYQAVLEPLGIEQINQCVSSYTYFFGGQIPSFEPSDFHSDPWISYAAGGVCMSARDAARYIQAYLDGTCNIERFIGESVELVSAEHDPAFGSRAKYGLGWAVRNSPAGQRVVFHTGKLPGFTTMFAVLPDQQRGVIILTNYGDFLVGTPAIEEVGEHIVAAVASGNMEYRVPSVGHQVAKARLRNLVGFGFYLVFCGFVSRRMPAWLSAGLAVVVPVTLRMVVRTPLRWIGRFVPDLASVLGCGSAILLWGAVRKRRR